MTITAQIHQQEQAHAPEEKDTSSENRYCPMHVPLPAVLRDTRVERVVPTFLPFLTRDAELRPRNCPQPLQTNFFSARKTFSKRALIDILDNNLA